MASEYDDDNYVSKRAAKSRKKRENKELSVSKIKEMYNAGLQALRTEQYNYWLNHSFLMGDQWLWVNPVTNNVEQLPYDSDRVQTKVNRLWPASRTIISKLTSRELTFEVIPSAADDATRLGAKTSEAILFDIAREHKWEELREDIGWAAWKGGTAAICTEWDAAAGTPLGMQDEEAEGKKFGTGDTVETALTIMDFVAQPGVRDAERGMWWIKAVAFPPSTVQDMFNLEECPKADASGAMTPFQYRLVSSGSRAQVDLTLVLTLYYRPCESYPEGAVISVVNDEIVDKAPWPYPFKDRLNLVIFKETRVNGRWTGETVLTVARPVQTALNQSWSSIIEHMKLAGNARLYVPMSSIDLIDQLTDLPAEIIPYPDGTTPPGFVAPPSMPDWWIRQPEMLAAEMDDILGVHDVSRGQAPTNIESGLGLSILAEQDSTPVGRMVKEAAHGFGRLGTLVLQIYADKVKETRTASIQHTGEAAEFVKWTGKDLQGQTTAEVPLDSIVPRSRAAMQAFAEKALQMGMIQTIAQFALLADLPGQKDYLEALSPDISKARWENSQMAIGSPEVPEDFDNHAEHIEQHHVFMKSQKWMTLSEEVKEIFRKHVQAHANLAAEEAAKKENAARMSAMLAATPDTTGGPTISPGEAGAALNQQLAPPEGEVAGAANDLQNAVQEQNPNIPPEVVEQGL